MVLRSIFLISLLFATLTVDAQNFTLKSSEIGGQMTNKQVFNGFGCTGENISPALSWENAPAGTKSFAILMYDPDAPTGSGWWHWVMFDIPAQTNSLKTNAGNPALKLAPKGAVQSMTDYGQTGFGGPCPPEGHGFHQYLITVYALDIEKLGLDHKINPAVAGYYINNHTLAKSSIVAYFKR